MLRCGALAVRRGARGLAGGRLVGARPMPLMPPAPPFVAAAVPAALRCFSIFKPKRIEQHLDMSHLGTQSSWTRGELDQVKESHLEPKDFVEKAAYWTVQLFRNGFDIISMYKLKMSAGSMRERDWLRRIIFLETVAGVPGAVAGMNRHLTSLRLMRRDYGWIHTLVAEAENERMHLLIALTLRQPGMFFRCCVITGQFVFLAWYWLMYLICPRYCHRFVGYLEEEAVHTYTKLLEEIDAGRLPMFQDRKAPKLARTYYNLPKTAMLRDVFECIRADESSHRDTNHHFSELSPDLPNTMVDHLTKGHFQHQSAYSGVLNEVHKLKEAAMLEEFGSHDPDNTGYISRMQLKKMLETRGDEVPEAELDIIIKEVDTDGDGRISYQEFARVFH